MKHPISPSARDERVGSKPMHLPFDPKRKAGGGWSGWVFRHRVGLLVTVVIYLSAAILFLTYQIVVRPASESYIEVEFAQEEQTPEERKIEEQKKVEQIDMSDQRMRNRVSDANSQLDATLRDSRRSNAKDVYAEAQRVQSQLMSGAEATARAMRDLDKMKGTRQRLATDDDALSGADDKRQTGKFSGLVSVEYNLPNRTDVYLYVPAYQCRNAGMVVVGVVVNRNGKVISATIDKTTSSDDPCIGEMAVKAALSSSFNTSSSAPDRQRGTITYTFQAQ